MRYRFTGNTMTAIRTSVRDAAPSQRAATHTHIHIHDARRSRDQLEEPDKGNEAEGCSVRLGDRFTVAGAANGGFALRRDGTRDEGGQTLLQQEEFGMGWPAAPQTVAAAVQGPRSPESPPDLSRVLNDRERRERAADRAAFDEIHGPRGFTENNVGAIRELQRRLDQHYGNRR